MDKIKRLITAIVCMVVGYILIVLFSWVPGLNIIGIIVFIVGLILISIATIGWAQAYGKKTLKDTMKEAYVEGKSEINSMEVLKTRLAKGEITMEQFEQIKKELKD